jgi:hypothetical protein
MIAAGPTYVQVSGYGVSVRPQPPFALYRSVGEALEVGVEIDGIEHRARVAAEPVYGSRREPFGELLASPFAGSWRLEVGGVYMTPWPEGVAIVSAPEPAEPPFCLFRIAPGALVYVQGPFGPGAAPGEGELAGTGQREVGRGRRGDARWVELAYEHAGERWRQRHYLRPLAGGATIAISTQAKEALTARVHAVADELADRLAPYRPA